MIWLETMLPVLHETDWVAIIAPMIFGEDSGYERAAKIRYVRGAEAWNTIACEFVFDSDNIGAWPCV